MGNVPEEARPSQQLSPAASASRPLLYKPLVHILLIVILGLLVYSNTFHSPFQWDEQTYISKNPVVHNLGYFLDPSKASGSRFYDALKGRYVGYLTFALNYHFGKYDVTGYHIVNLAIHLTNAILVYLLIMLTLKTPYFRGHSAEGIAQQAGKRASLQACKQQAVGSLASNLQPAASNLHPYNSGFEIQDSRYLIALFGSLLFVSHPLQTEAVTYIFQRLASLVTMFYMLSIVFYIKGRLSSLQADKLASDRQQATGGTQPRTLDLKPPTNRLSVIAYYILSLLFAVLAMKTKENAFTLPVVITLFELYFFYGPLKKRLLRLVPLLLTLLIIPLTLIGTGKPVGEVISQVKDPAAFGFKGIPASAYLMTQFRVIVTYLRLLFLPVNQDLNYDYPAYHSLSQPAVLLSFLLLLFLVGLAGYLLIKSKGHRAKGKEQQAGKQQAADSNPPSSPLKIRGDRGGLCLKLRGDEGGLSSNGSRFAYYRLISFGILWFFITLSVESSIIPIPMLIDEYRVYLPSVGAFTAIIAVFFALTGGRGRGFLRRGRVVAALALFVLLFSGATYARNSVWKDQVSLWQDVVRKSPDKASGYNNLGLAYERTGQYEKALKMFGRAIVLAPAYTDAYSNRGTLYGRTGKLDNALWDLNKAIALSPSYANAYSNRGMVFQLKGDLERAVKDYNRAIELNPYLYQAYYNRGMVFEKEGRLNEAIADLDRVIRMGQADTAAAYSGRAMVYEKMGQAGRAKEDYLRAVTLQPTNEEAHVRLGILYGKAGSLDKAIEHFNRALALAPKDGVAYNDRGFAYYLMGKYDMALEDFNKAIVINPKHVSAYINRGKLYLKRGDVKLAAADFRKACDLKDEGACETLRSLRISEK